MGNHPLPVKRKSIKAGIIAVLMSMFSDPSLPSLHGFEVTGGLGVGW